MLKHQYPRKTLHFITWIHNKTFHTWFLDQVSHQCIILIEVLILQLNSFILILLYDCIFNKIIIQIMKIIIDDFKYLACFPNNDGRKFESFIINRFRFHTKEPEKRENVKIVG